jgi:hypothetical protein
MKLKNGWKSTAPLKPDAFAVIATNTAYGKTYQYVQSTGGILP